MIKAAALQRASSPRVRLNRKHSIHLDGPRIIATDSHPYSLVWTSESLLLRQSNGFPTLNDKIAQMLSSRTSQGRNTSSYCSRSFIDCLLVRLPIVHDIDQMVTPPSITAALLDVISEKLCRHEIYEIPSPLGNAKIERDQERMGSTSSGSTFDEPGFVED